MFFQSQSNPENTMNSLALSGSCLGSVMSASLVFGNLLFMSVIFDNTVDSILETQ